MMISLVSIVLMLPLLLMDMITFVGVYAAPLKS
jgi:hypothetical protein